MMTDSEMPTMTRFMNFLENQSQVLQVTDTNLANKPNIIFKQNNGWKQVVAVAQSTNSCVICRGVHKIYACEKFKCLQVKERIEIVKTKRLCFNCLNVGHVTVDCRWTRCKTCGKKHNTLLHLDSKTANQRDKNSSDVTTLEATSNFNGLSYKVYNTIILSQSVLSMAIINVKDNEGRLIHARALLDSGAQSNFITEKLARYLQLRRDYIDIPVETLNQVETRVKYSIMAEILSRRTNYHEKAQFLILPTICNKLPNEFIDRENVSIPSINHWPTQILTSRKKLTYY
jgi:hypothetical protein